jgi:hypothetical protein
MVTEIHMGKVFDQYDKIRDYIDETFGAWKTLHYPNKYAKLAIIEEDRDSYTEIYLIGAEKLVGVTYYRQTALVDVLDEVYLRIEEFNKKTMYEKRIY